MTIQHYTAQVDYARRHLLSSVFTILVFATTVFVITIDAAKAEWRFEPVVRIAGNFNDNPKLSTGTNDSSESGYIAEGSLRSTYAAATSSFFIEPRLRTRSYGSNSDLDSDDQFLKLQYDRDTPLTNFRFRTNYSRESVRTAELADTDFDIEDPDEIVADDSGRVDLRDRRKRLLLSPSFQYRFTDVSAIAAKLDYYDVGYDDLFQGQLIDYTDSRLELSYRRSWTQRNTAIVAATYRKYQADDQGLNDIDGIGLNVGFDRQISATTRFRATAGIEDTDLVNSSNSEVEWVANVSLARRLETTTLLAQYRRNINASGSGRLAARDAVNLNFTRELNERISAGIGARVYRTNGIGDQLGTFDERSYVQLRSQFTWYLSQAYSIEANYRHTFLDREVFNESANSNEITIWFTYQPQAIIR